MLLTVAHQVRCSFGHLVRAGESCQTGVRGHAASGLRLAHYLDAFKARLDPQLFHQFPGLGDVISSGHTDPSDCTSPGENWETPREGGKKG